mmetsp:Transcript_68593/g.139576  ORF Transcript_68593/g.139576 Transcript_68593/m.139576 type:complete len:275 (-) Transcript_68593:2112-2936(-)
MRVSIHTTKTNHRQEIETKYRQDIETNDRQESEELKPRKESPKKPNGMPFVSHTTRFKFKSVLTHPFSLWNEIEDIVGEFLVYLNCSQRSSVIKNLIRFLELKVIMEEYSSDGLLSPTDVVAHVWHVLILETELYRDVVESIQDFHARPHRFIHHSLVGKFNTKEYCERLERTQRLFKSCYGNQMPTSQMMETDRQPHLSSTVTVNASPFLNESINGGTFNDTQKVSRWWLSSCYCFDFEESLCGGKPKNCFEYNEIYPQGENVSLLTTPYGLE